MSRLLTLLVVLALLAVVQAAVAVLLIALAIMLLFYVATRPKETLIFILTLLLFGLASARPIACIVAFGVVGLSWVALDARRKTRKAWPTADEVSRPSPNADEIQQNLIR